MIGSWQCWEQGGIQTTSLCSLGQSMHQTFHLLAKTHFWSHIEEYIEGTMVGGEGIKSLDAWCDRIVLKN
jgi:hypothetical protein